MVFPVVMYGCESWTVKKAEHQRIDAFGLWCWRRLLRVPARKSNQSIQKEISPGCSLEVLMLRLKLQYFGHLMWRTDSLEKTLMLGVIAGGKRRGQQRMRWLDGITDSMGLSLKLKTILNSHSSSDFQSVSLWIYRFVWIIIRLLWCSNCSQLAIGSPLKWVHVLLVGLHCSFNASSLPDIGQLRPPLAPRGFLLILVHVPLGDGLSSLLFWLSLLLHFCCFLFYIFHWLSCPFLVFKDSFDYIGPILISS